MSVYKVKAHHVEENKNLETEDTADACMSWIESVLGAGGIILSVERVPTKFSYIDKFTGEPCPQRGDILCTIFDPEHRHVSSSQRVLTHGTRTK